jgi:uncharacterized membrane protein (UPF0136 family)
MIVRAQLFYYVFGLITLGGGIQAFVSVKSKASLIAGGISGLLLLLAGWLIQAGQGTAGLILGLIVSLGLAGRFLPKFFKEKSWWPAGVEGWLGVIGVVLTVLAFVVK